MLESNDLYVLDANVFIHGAVRGVPEEFSPAVTVPAVTEELRSRDAGRRFDLAQVDVYEPGEDAVKDVAAACAELGEELSDTDVAVVALALEKDAVVVSDDYGVQNVAAFLDVSFTGFLEEEITEQLQWRQVCTQCGTTVEDVDMDTDVEDCPSCGGAVKRQVVEREQL